MTNRLAPYKDPRILHTVTTWWDTRIPQDAVFFNDLFADYTRKQLDDYNLPHILTTAQFAKCLTALGILHLGNGIWRQSPDWHPSSDSSTVTRATAPEPHYADQ